VAFAMLVRAMPGWWRLLAVPLALVLLEFALLPLTVAVYATNLPPGPLGSATPAAFGLTYRDAVFRTSDGIRLSAWYVPPRNGAAVVLLPGAGSTRTVMLGQPHPPPCRPGWCRTPGTPEAWPPRPGPGKPTCSAS
jgi:hypothetical protein